MVKSIGSELYLRRLTLDEAIPKLEQYLDDAFMAGLTQVSIVHGKGTGKLRNAVHSKLSGHPLVRSYRIGVYGEGEQGVTLVELVSRFKP